MKELFYSEQLKKYYDTKEACLAAEKEYEEKHAIELKAKEERAAKAKAVEEAYKNYLQLRSDFIKEYGQYHMTLTEKDLPKANSILDMFDWLFM